MFRKLLRALGGRGAPRPTSDWGQLAESLGLRYRKGNPERMSGTIDGQKVSLTRRRGGEWQIEVEFDSGLQDFSLHQRSRNTKIMTNRHETVTDSELDSRFRVFTHGADETRALISWLTPARRSVLIALDDGFVIDELEEDELEVRLRTDDATIDELREAIQVCLWAAKELDKSASLQD